MANTDIKTRIVLDSKNFDQKIETAKKSVKNYESGINSLAKTAGSSLIKFAGAFGVAMGAAELFNKAVNSTQTTGDAWIKMQDEMKGALDTFYVALSTGNFQGFLDNLSDAINKAGRLSVILDNLGTKTLFNNAEYDDLKTKYQLEIDAAKARNMSDAERNKHLVKAKNILKEMVSLRGPLKSANNEAYYANLDADAATFFRGNIKRSTWDYVMKDSNRSKVEQSAANYKKTAQSYSSRIKSSQIYDDVRQKMVDTPETKKIRAEFNKYRRSSQGKYEEFAKQFIEQRDDESSKIAEAIKIKAAANAITLDISSKQLEVANADAKINGSFNKQNKEGGKGSRIKKDEILPPGSIAAINKDILDLQKKFEKATTDTARIAIQSKIDELKKLIQTIDLTIKYSKPVSDTHSDYKSLKDDWARQAATNPPITDGLIVKGLPPVYTKSDVKTTNDYADSLNGIAQIIGNIQGATDGAASSWLNYMGNIMSGAAGMATAVMALSDANKAEAASASGAAAAEAIKSAAQTPLVGWLMVGAAAASVIAALASIPKFETGGIVPGASFNGDKILARVNSGEMILNSGQQANLFNMLNNGAPASSPAITTVKVRGSDLYLAISNYSKKSSNHKSL